MICSVIDGLFDPLFLHELHSKIVEIPLTTTNIANRKTWPYGHIGSHKLFGTTLFRREGLNRVTHLHSEVKTFFDIFEALEKVLYNNIFHQEQFLLTQISLNVQHTHCHGSVHIDTNSSEYTILMMTNAIWNDNWGGQFQLTNVDGTQIVEEHDYLPGRIIIMPSNHPHRGLGPVEPYIYRTSVVFRISNLNNFLKF